MPGHALTLSRTNAASVFVLSSNNEGLPAVLIEAMAVGIPVVSTSCKSGPKEILSGGRLGMLVPVGSKNHMTKAILETLDSSHANIPSIKSFIMKYNIIQATNEFAKVLSLDEYIIN